MLSQGPITLSQEECSYVVFLRLQVFLPRTSSFWVRSTWLGVSS